MSVDQVLLYRGCRALIEGRVPADLAKRALGPICHARWLTLALRIVFLYMTFASPSPELYRLAWFVVNIYGYLWFSAKKNWRATEAPLLAFDAMRLIRELPQDEQRIIRPVYERGFMHWCHPEQLILACLGDHDPDVRAQAVARIICQRNNHRAATTEPPRAKKSKGGKGKEKNEVRTFILPTPLYEAQHYSTMIDWANEQSPDPPYLRDASDLEIREYEVTPLVLDISSNSQFVERFIQLIAKNGTRAASPTVRDGLVKSTLRSRKQRPRMETKADFRK